MKIKGFQNQLREARKLSKKSDTKKGKKPPSIKMNYRGMASNYITTLNDSWRTKSLKKYLNPSKVMKNKSSNLIKRFAIELGKNKRKSENRKKNTFKPEFTGKIDTDFFVRSLLNENPTISPKSKPSGNTKGSTIKALKKRRNSNMATTFNLTGNLAKKKKVGLNFYKFKFWIIYHFQIENIFKAKR